MRLVYRPDLETSGNLRTRKITDGAYTVVFFLGGMVLLQPTWPVALGVVAGCATVAYVARLALPSDSRGA